MSSQLFEIFLYTHHVFVNIHNFLTLYSKHFSHSSLNYPHTYPSKFLTHILHICSSYTYSSHKLPHIYSNFLTCSQTCSLFIHWNVLSFKFHQIVHRWRFLKVLTNSFTIQERSYPKIYFLHVKEYKLNLCTMVTFSFESDVWFSKHYQMNLLQYICSLKSTWSKQIWSHLLTLTSSALFSSFFNLMLRLWKERHDTFLLEM